MKVLVLAAMAALVMGHVAVADDEKMLPNAKTVGTFKMPVADFFGNGQILKFSDSDATCYVVVVPRQKAVLKTVSEERPQMAFSCVPKK